jgi:hypothetical protein
MFELSGVSVGGSVMATKTPCMDCSERHIACSDHCPKDARGEYGYKAYKSDLYKLKKAEREYKRQNYEDFRNSELRERHRQKYVSSKFGRNIWKDRENI